MDVAGLGVDEVGGEGAGVPPEQGVGQRAVAPGEAGEVQPHDQHRERVDEPGRRVGTQRGGEQRAVGQRELQVPRDERGLERVAVVVRAAGDDADGVDARDVEAAELEQQVVLALGERLADLLDGVDAAGEPDEAHDVPRDAAGERHEGRSGQSSSGSVPRQEEQVVLTRRGGDAGAAMRSDPRVSG